MSYIGATPAESYASFYVQHFTTSATTSYALDYPVVNENDLRLVINNVVQQPGSGYSYTAAASTLTLSAATTTSDTMYAVFLGRALQTVNPPGDSVGVSQLADTVISGQTALGAEPADTDEFLVSDAGTLKRMDYSYIKGGGKIGQVVQTVNTGTETLSSTTPTTISDFTVAITPAATSSKVLVMVNAIITVNNNNSMGLQLFRDTTQIFMGDAASSRARSSWTIYANVDRQMWPTALCYLDSPSSTSAIDYSCKWFSQGSAAAYMNRSALDSDNATYDQRTASSITVMEILA